MQRYLTRGINEQIPIKLQVFCWQCYDAAKVTGNYDYLQVFELKILDEQTQQVEQ